MPAFSLFWRCHGRGLARAQRLRHRSHFKPSTQRFCKSASVDADLLWVSVPLEAAMLEDVGTQCTNLPLGARNVKAASSHRLENSLRVET